MQRTQSIRSGKSGLGQDILGHSSCQLLSHVQSVSVVIAILYDSRCHTPAARKQKRAWFLVADAILQSVPMWKYYLYFTGLFAVLEIAMKFTVVTPNASKVNTSTSELYDIPVRTTSWSCACPDRDLTQRCACSCQLVSFPRLLAVPWPRPDPMMCMLLSLCVLVLFSVRALTETWPNSVNASASLCPCPVLCPCPDRHPTVSCPIVWTSL
jgi:hypothetical protein